MSDFLDIPTLIAIGVAVMVLLRLRAVLGTRTGNERPPSTRIKERDEATDDNKVVKLHPKSDEDNIVAQETKEADAAARDAERQLAAEIKKFSRGDEILEKGLSEISEIDKAFTPKSFIEGAKGAYEMIVTAFAAGDRKTLKNLLEKEVFEGFQSVISEREKAGYKVDFTFVGLPKVEFGDAKMEKRNAVVSIRFFAEIVSATRDGDGNLIEGNADQVAHIADSWTFARNTRSDDPNWKLVATDQLD